MVGLDDFLGLMKELFVRRRIRKRVNKKEKE